MRMRTAGMAWLLAVIAACAPLGGAEAPDQARRVLEVRVRGNRKLSDDAVLVHVRTRVGHLYDTKVITADRQRLLRTGRFDSVVIYGRPKPDGVIVTCEVVERDLLATIVLRGNRAFKDRDLLKSLTFSAGGAIDIFAIEAGRRTLRLKYRNAGYYFAKVSYDKQVLKQQQQVVYTIVEGPKVRVRSIELEGVTYLGTMQRRWLKIFGLRASARSRWSLIPGGTLKDEDLEHDVNEIRTRYEDDGFLAVKVSRKLEFSPDKTEARLVYVVQENARFYVNRIILDGNKIFSDAELARRIGVKRGDVVRDESLKVDVERLRRTYGQLGYVDASVRFSKQYPRPGTPLPQWARGLDDAYPVALMSIVFMIDEGAQSRVGRIDVRSSPVYKYGDTVTQRRIALRKMTLLPGQLFSTTAAKRSEARIMETQIFRKATVKPIEPIGPVPREFNIHDAVVEVAEGKTGNLLFGLGLSTDTGLGATVSYRQRNFDIDAWPAAWSDLTWRELVYGHVWRGAAQTLQISASPGTRFSRLNMSWYEPAVDDRPYSLRLKAYAVSGIRESHDENRMGIEVGVGHRFKNGWYGQLTSRTVDVQIADIEDDAPAQIVNLEGHSFLQGIEASLVRNRTDSRWKPSTGDLFRFSVEQVLGDFTFEKVVAEYRVYQTLHVNAFDQKHILSAKAWAGQIVGYAPTFERFYGGGIGSVRGFKYRGISPRSGRRDEPIGGAFVAYVGGEYSYPLAGEHLRGVVFLDSGTVHQDVQFDTWRVATGFGFRLIIPGMGPVPVSLDFGFPLIKDSQDETRLVSFTLGWTF